MTFPANHTVGDRGHVEGHNAIEAALNELRWTALTRTEVTAAVSARFGTPSVLVFVGSSTTAGSNVLEAERWVSILAARASDFPARTSLTTAPTGSGVRVYNGGLSGAETGAIRNLAYVTPTTATQIAALNPAAVVHMITANDYALGVDPLVSAENIRTRIGWIDAAATKPVTHVLIHSFRRGDTLTQAAYEWDQYGEAQRALAVSLPNVAYLDVSREFAALGVPGTDPLDLLSSDNVHLTSAGHRVMADVVFRSLGLASKASPDVVGAIYAADDFRRTDGPLRSTPIGARPWTLDGGTIEIVSNTARATAGAGSTGRGGSATIDGPAAGVLRLTGHSAGVGLYFRGTADGFGYAFIYGATNVYRLTKRMTNSFSQVAATSVGTLSPNDELTVEMIGDRIICRVNGVVGVDVVDTEFRGTRHGVIYTNVNLSVGNFSHRI